MSLAGTEEMREREDVEIVDEVGVGGCSARAESGDGWQWDADDEGVRSQISDARGDASGYSWLRWVCWRVIRVWRDLRLRWWRTVLGATRVICHDLAPL